MARSQRDWSGDDAQDYMITVGDLMAGLVFLFMITLMLFIIRFHQETEALQSATETRSLILEELRERLEREGLQVTVDHAQGVLRLSDADETIGFPSGRESVFPEHVDRVASLAGVLAEVVPCFSFVTSLPCEVDLDREQHAGWIHALNIEGHTDTVPFAEASGSRFLGNLELSVARAAHIHGLILNFEDGLGSLLNSDSVPLLGVSGYGPNRRLPDLPGDDARHRRIDLRFLMEPPQPDWIPEPVRAVEGQLSPRGATP